MHHLLYFSPTGHCRRLANALEECLTQTGLTLQCHDLTPASRRQSAPQELAGEGLWLVLPVYAQGLPAPVVAWLKSHRLRFRFAAVICLYGGKSAGNALRQSARLLRRWSVPVVWGAEIPTPHSYLTETTAFVPPRTVLSTGIGRAQENAQTGKKPRFPYRLAVGRLFPQRLLARLAVALPQPTSTCTGCGDCRGVCPVEAIRQDHRVDANRCIRCAACARACPQRARQWRVRFWVTRWYLSHGQSVPKTPRSYG